MSLASWNPLMVVMVSPVPERGFSRAPGLLAMWATGKGCLSSDSRNTGVLPGGLRSPAGCRVCAVGIEFVGRLHSVQDHKQVIRFKVIGNLLLLFLLFRFSWLSRLLTGWVGACPTSLLSGALPFPSPPLAVRTHCRLRGSESLISSSHPSQRVQ